VGLLGGFTGAYPSDVLLVTLPFCAARSSEAECIADPDCAWYVHAVRFADEMQSPFEACGTSIPITLPTLALMKSTFRTGSPTILV
jgi:hypothetical protein